jgi:stage V sporulation protein B
MSKFVAEYEAINEKEMAYATIKSGLRLETYFALGFCGIAFLLNPIITERFFDGRRLIFVIFILAVPIEGYYGVFYGIFRGLRELKWLGYIKIGENVIRFLLILVFLALLGFGLTVAAGIYALTILMACLVSWGAMKPLCEGRIRQTSELCVRKIFAFALPVSLVASINSAVLESAPILVKMLTPNDTTQLTGFVVMVLSLVNAPNAMFGAILSAGYPHISRWYAQADIKSLNIYFRQLAIAIIAFYAFFFIGAHLFASRFIAIVYGDSYILAVKYLMPAIVAFSAVSMASLCRIVLYGIGMVKDYFYLVCGAMAFYVFSIVLLNAITNVAISVILAIGVSNTFLILGSLIIKRKALIKAESEKTREKMI